MKSSTSKAAEELKQTEHTQLTTTSTLPPLPTNDSIGTDERPDNIVTTSDMNTTGVIVPNEHDVLMGRGENFNQYIGKEHLFEMAHQVSDRYKTCSPEEKVSITKELVQSVRNLNPPGRFLRRNQGTSEWEDVGDTVAMEIVGQILRDAVNEAELLAAANNANTNQNVARDPSGKLIYEPSQKMPYKPSCRLISHNVSTRTPRCHPNQLLLPEQANQSVIRNDSAISALTGVGGSSFFMKASGLFRSPGGQAYDPHKEFLTAVQFHWNEEAPSSKACWCPVKPDHPTLPPVLWPYLQRHHWAQFLQALADLAARNHYVGTVYVVMGVLASACGLAYFLYGVVPSPDKFCSMYIAVGVGAALLLAGICLWIWGRANRKGGVVYDQDLEVLCENMSSQIPGVTVQYYSAQTLRQRQPGERSKTLCFAVELFATEDGEELETTHPAYSHNDVMSQHTSSDSQPSKGDAIDDIVADMA